MNLAIKNGLGDRLKEMPVNFMVFPILQKNSKLTGYVVACGLQYGKGENIFHYFFKVDINVTKDDSVCSV